MRVIVCFLLFFPTLINSAQTIRVGAKHFNEGYILSEMLAQLLESNGIRVDRKFNLGGTMVCFEALRNNEIDIYPEYSGTLAFEVLGNKNSGTFEEINRELGDRYNLAMSRPFGFSNSYALVIRRDVAERRNLHSILDLRHHRDLRAGISYEFLKRRDGWENLARVYSLTQVPTALEHGLAYQALRDGKIDITDAYSTDGEIPVNSLLLLADDLNFFPPYQATCLYRKDLPTEIQTIISTLGNKISNEDMQRMNARVLFEKKTIEEVAVEFLISRNLLQQTNTKQRTVFSDVMEKTARHLLLTFSALLFALIVAVPLGVVVCWYPHMANPVLYATGLLQTIPSIALLAIMIPAFGIGITPAVTALFLYSLLPILRNTVVGMQSVDPLLKSVADGMGMNRFEKLRWLEFPLAFPAIVAGMRTAAVINVGTATLAAFIGAGGLGEYIVTGLALNSTNLILRGALPAAGLALTVELFFELVERKVKPKFLKQR